MMWRTNIIKVALGRKPADLVIVNGQLVNVHTAEIYPVDVAIAAGRVAIVGDVSRATGPETEVFDARGCFLVPGLIDAHMHTESSGVTLTQLSRILLPRGVTTIMYAHEIANVLGVPGMDLVREEARLVPLKIYFETPTSVPWAPGLEMPATPLSVDDVRQMLEWKESVSLGESDYFDLLDLDQAILSKIEAAYQLGKPVNGHAAMASQDELMAAIGAGFSDDHENYSADEVLAKLRLGMKVILREANIPWLAEAVTEHDIDTRNLLLCIDDKLVTDLLSDGGVDHTVRVAITHGIDPMTAIQMATINAAVHFRVDFDVGSISPGKIADILITESLEELPAKAVIANGQLVGRDGSFVPDLPVFEYPDWAKSTVHLKGKLSADDFEILANIEEGEVKARVMEISAGGWVRTWESQPLPVRAGKVVLGSPYERVAVVERHGGDGNIAVGIAEGIGLKHGAVASSVSHDCHNVTVLGTNTADMAACVNALAATGGGFAAAQGGEIVALVEFEIAGLMSQAPYEEVVEKLDRFETVIRSELGFPDDMEFIVFNFIALQSSPFQAAITDRGLIDTYSRRVVPVIISSTTP
jgi:adenine deaminase